MNKLFQVPAPASAAEHQVHAITNTFLRKRSNEQTFVTQLTAVCQRHPGAAWQALSALDQLHRRTAISTELFRTIKKALNQIVFNSTGKYFAVPPQRPGDGPDLRVIVGGLNKHEDSDVTTIDFLEPLTLPQPANAVSFEPLRVGALLHDRYDIIEPLAAGSASVTFKARDRRLAPQSKGDDQVAIRWLDEHLQSDPHAIAALRSEYARLRALAHRNIPKALALHTTAAASSIVMELPAGEFLPVVIERLGTRRLPVELARSIIREIGSALVHAHARGVVHGNLHMGSVLLGANGQVYVYDFARADVQVSRAEQLTGSSSNCVPLASRRYCSPQRLQSMNPRAADDLYSLAAIAYELLCAQPLAIDALQNSVWRPREAKHLSWRQWRALKRAFAAAPVERGSLNDWLIELGVNKGRASLPASSYGDAEMAPTNRYSVPRWY